MDRKPAAVSDWDDELIALYRSHRLALLRLAVLLTDDPSLGEDLVQDAFVALQRRWASVDRAAAAGYLRTTVLNSARSFHRHRLVAWRHLRVAKPEGTPSADVAVLLSEEHQRVVAAVRRLPRRQREVLVLRYWSGLTCLFRGN